MKKTQYASALLTLIKRDPVLILSLLAAVISACFVPPSLAYWQYLDMRVLCLLLSLMLVVSGLQKAGVFTHLVEQLLRMAHNTRNITVILVLVCFFSSMLITNDVALITFVPLSILLFGETNYRDLLIPVIVLQTIASNLGSMFTPMGNPQNLYLYSYFQLSLREFLLTMAVPAAASLVLLLVNCLLIKARPMPLPESADIKMDRKRALLYGALFSLCILCVIHLLHYTLVLAIVAVAVLILDRELMKKADYGLLLTFIFFFIFVGNLKSIPAVSDMLSAMMIGREMTVSILLSQIISNVPAAMLLSGFTNEVAALLVGVNLGGLGTLIASMASLISYKLYAAQPEAKGIRYLAVFSAINLVFLFLLWGLQSIIL